MSLPSAKAVPAAPSFLALVVDDVTRETVRQVAARLGWPTKAVREGGVVAARTVLESAPAPSVLLVDVSDCEQVLAAMDSLAEVCEPHTRVIALGTVNDISLYRSLMQLGVSDYLVKPCSADSLADAFRRAEHEVRPAPPVRKARSVALIGARGGVGVTSLAAALAWGLAHDQRRRTILLDLDLQFGAAALSLDVEPGRGLRELLAHPERIDGLLLGSAVSRVGEHLALLGAEEALDNELQIAPDGIEVLLNALAESADEIVIDMPRRLDGLARAALARTDVTAVVTDLTLPGLRDTQRLLALLAALRPGGEVLLVANRLGGVAGEIARSEFERLAGRTLDIVIPHDAKAAAAAAERAATLLNAAPAAPAATAMRRLLERLAGHPAPMAGSAAWLNRLLGRARDVRP